MTHDHFLAEAEFRALVMAIAKMLDGLCIDQIEHVLRSTSKLCAQGAAFSTESTAFQLNANLAETPPGQQ